MSEQESIDERRKWIVSAKNPECLASSITGRCTSDCLCECIARAIRLSDEAAGYITAKLETLESAKERRS